MRDLGSAVNSWKTDYWAYGPHIINYCVQYSFPEFQGFWAWSLTYVKLILPVLLIFPLELYLFGWGLFSYLLWFFFLGGLEFFFLIIKVQDSFLYSFSHKSWFTNNNSFLIQYNKLHHWISLPERMV